MSLKIDVWIESDRDRQRVRYRNSRGAKKPWGSYASKSEANKAKDKLIEKLKREHFGECDPDLPVREAFTKWVAAARAGLSNRKGKRIQESTIETWHNSFKGVFEEAEAVMELDEAFVKDYIGRMMALDYEEWTIHRRLTDLKSFLNWARREKLITWDAFENIPISIPEAVPRFYTDEELDKFEWAAKDNDVMRLWIRLGYLAGLRRKEVSQAQRENVRWLPDDSGHGELTIWGWQAKSRVSRTVPLEKGIMECVGTRREGPLVPLWKENKFLYEFEALKVKAGIKEPHNWFSKKFEWAKANKDPKSEALPARFHDFRHTFCKVFLQEHGDISRLHKITGHKNLNVLVKVYGHFETHHLHESVEAVANRRKSAGQWRGKLDIIPVNSGHTESHRVTEKSSSQNQKGDENTVDSESFVDKKFNLPN